MFSLCIATMNRFETFLKKNLPRYLQNPLISEIVISDENGEDAEKIKTEFSSSMNQKLFLYVNEKRLGPFLNKLNALRKSKGQWVCLMDSDNFADEQYFLNAKNYIEEKQIEPDFTMLMPSFAKPQFNYKHLPEVFSLEEPGKPYLTCFNTGNFILSRNLFENINLEGEDDFISHSSSCDVIYFNTLLIEQLPYTKIYIPRTLEYEHTVHKGSIYLQTYKQEKQYNELAQQRFLSLFWNTIPSNLFYCPNKDTYPPFKKGLYLEEYFYQFYKKKIISENKKGKRKYIPALWTNFQIEPWFPKRKKEMQKILNDWVSDFPSQHGYFTVVQYDDAALLTLPPNTKVFGACSGDEPIPLIYEDTDLTLENQPKKKFEEKTIFCSFIGSMTSNNVQPNVRMRMKQEFEGNPKFQMRIGNWTNNVQKGNQDDFVKTTLNSKFALAPRGYGRSSFRFFEILQLGTIPIYVWNDRNWLPFQDVISYSKFSIVLHVSQMGVLEEKLNTITQEKYEQMLQEYEEIKHYFTLEGMSEEIYRRDSI